MRLKLAFSLTLLIAIQSVTCQNQHNRQRGNVNDESQKLNIVADSVTNLAQKISNAITSQKSKTEIFSPVSIAGALSLLLLGASGTTRTELENVMGFDSRISFTDIHKSFGKLFRELVTNDPILKSEIPWRATDKCNNYDYDDDDVGMRGGFQAPQTPAKRPKRQSESTSDFDRYSHEIQLANGIFLENSYELSQSYINKTRVLYSSEVEKLNFALDPDTATKRMNEWIRTNTHDKISEMFPATVDSNTVMVIASALYFKALWQDMFIEGATKPRDFWPEGKNGPSFKVDMMAHGGCFPFYESPELEASIIGLPYKNNQSTMYVLKPTNSNRKALQELIAKLNAAEIDNLINRMRMTTALILFPKMHVSNTLNLKKTLKHIGVKSIFNPSKSDFSEISGASRIESVDNRPADLPNFVSPVVNLPPKPAKRPVDKDHAIITFPRVDVANETNTIEQATEEPQTSETTELVEEMQETSLKMNPEDTTTSNTVVESESKPQPKSNVRSMARSRKNKRDVSYKTPTEVKGKPDPLNGKDFFLNKRIVKPTSGKKQRRRSRRDAVEQANLYVSEAIHKIDLQINERGTEGGAATAITLNRSGTNAVFRAEEPFLILIRNDRTKLPLFFGAVYDPRAE
ncbi:serine protease inhibitor 28Dc-like isoform X2 [Uranotaenia lowii]|uniref:serine protease inhibitor 28Dc-like isoform X2 n=1 Tax=Uranotaenia lowii TaxID=190385 RepID=UPI00247AB08B|nr:serine protease inhibitor 28Dc-like isoform X2 [Uranotaenia lowii]